MAIKKLRIATGYSIFLLNSILYFIEIVSYTLCAVKNAIYHWLIIIQSLSCLYGSHLRYDIFVLIWIPLLLSSDYDWFVVYSINFYQWQQFHRKNKKTNIWNYRIRNSTAIQFRKLFTVHTTFRRYLFAIDVSITKNTTQNRLLSQKIDFISISILFICKMREKNRT